MEQIDFFFPASVHKIKSHIFKNIYECSIHELIPFKYNNTHDLCDKLQDKDRRGNITVKKCFVLQKEVIDVIHDKKIVPPNKNSLFILPMLQFLVQWNMGGLEIIFFMIMYQKTI